MTKIYKTYTVYSKNEKTAFMVGGTGIKYYFNLNQFNKTIDFLINKFYDLNLNKSQIIQQLFYYLSALRFKGLTNNCKYNTIALKNIIELDYDWSELF